MSLTESDSDIRSTTRRRAILRIGIWFFAILLLLTFFSKTILNLSLPRVGAVDPSSGTLIREIQAEGTIAATHKTEMYVDARCRVREVRVAPGDLVRAGEILIVLDAGERNADRDAALAAARRGDGDLESLFTDIAAAAVKTLDGAVELSRMKVDSLTTRVANVKSLQARGAESSDNVARAQLDLTQAAQDLSERTETRDQRKQEILRALESSVLVCAADASVSSVAASVGGFVDPSQPVITLLPRTAGLELTVTVPVEKAKLLSLGETIEVAARGGAARTAEGRITRIVTSSSAGAGFGELKISIPAGSDLGPGDDVDISIQKQTRSYPLLVPNAAVAKSATGNFVYVLTEHAGALGTEYYAVQSNVTVVESDDFMSAIGSGIDPTEKIIVRWSKPLTDTASRVMVE